MANSSSILQQLGCFRSLVSRPNTMLQTPSVAGRRMLSTVWSAKPKPVPLPKELPEQFLAQLPHRMRPELAPKKRKIPRPPPGPACKDPVGEVVQRQLKKLDPFGKRRELFDYRRHARSVKPGDIIRVTFKNGDPFSGVVLSIKLRGVDTSVLLRNQLTRVGVEMSVKVYSPNVESVEIVQRTEKRKRRARLYYLRQPRHDIGSVENIVTKYLRQKRALTGGVKSNKKR
ncbi:mitochondrial 54S ribosomal protein bL19m [Aspergillus saccharolyticus JOP 1030-1]|uniref:Mitochondrial ribosomal protein n=1 Tax=Aspergillus saccharolyticus JOP 1030-1 TaxID=1450539 RepID=A0A318ZQL8_9EURO|nr:mitochondrial ribosomal protein [Aspergillus saccharolyticus JOP 1030-1]PYH48854.1 mitochondrial ribosomal protein [Aspergillus saccharolyticus JOP 1030-1]